MTADDLKQILKLTPMLQEGGFFVETYRSDEVIPSTCLPDRLKGPRAFSTAIYYLLTPDSFSAMHRLAYDEIFHFYLGDPVEMLQLKPGGEGEILTIGAEVSSTVRPQVVVPRFNWQGARLIEGGQFALLGTTVAPGFEYEEYETGKRAALISEYP